MTMADLESALGKELAKSGHGVAMKQKWLAMDKASKTCTKPVLQAAVDGIEDTVVAQLRQLSNGVTLAQVRGCLLSRAQVRLFVDPQLRVRC